jgi:putative transposase
MERKRYPSDLSDQEWEILEPLFPPPKPGGCPRSVNLREVMNAIFYVLHGGFTGGSSPRGFHPGRRSITTSASVGWMVPGRW